MSYSVIPTDQPVSLVRRLLCIVYDLFLVAALVFLAAIPPVVLFSKPAEQQTGLQGAFYEGHPLWEIGFYLYLLVVVFLFFGWFWTHGGQTLGMKTWGVRVEGLQGEPLNWGRALKRYLLALLSWLPAGAGFLMSLFRRDRMSFHDLYSNTRLIRVRYGKKD